MYEVIEHSETNLRMIGHMTKRLLKFEILNNSLKIVWGENEKTKGCATCIDSQWTLWNRFEDDTSHDQKAIKVLNFQKFTENSLSWKWKN